MPNRIKEFRDQRGWSLERVAREIGDGVSKSQIWQLEKGNFELTELWLRRFSRAFGCHPWALVAEGEAVFAPLIGRVGAGERIEVDPADASHEPIPCPPGFTNPIAVVVRGTSMLPVYRDSDVLFGERLDPGAPFDEALEVAHKAGKRLDCAVQVRNGDLLIKSVIRGSRAKAYHLLSYNRDDMLADQRLDWAAPITWIHRA